MKNTKYVTMIMLLFAMVVAACDAQRTAPIACTQEAKICPDGTAVGRTGPNCEFGQCPRYNESKNLSANIKTPKGDLTLAYKDEKSVLTGALERITPCVSWKVYVPIPLVPVEDALMINIFDENKNKDIVCIQVVAEPQEIFMEFPYVTEKTIYGVYFEGKSVFEGMLKY